MKIVERVIVKEAPVSPSVAEWNFWDFEHGEFVHEGHVEHWVLFEDSTTAVIIATTRVPILSFLKYSSLHVMVRVSETLSQAWNRGWLGVIAAANYQFEKIGRDRTRITITYRFYLQGWRILLAPLLYRQIGKWSNRIWEEDLPLKLRRQQVMRLGFKDFVGLPDAVADRHNDSDVPLKLPLPKLKNSPVMRLIK
jgi:hypothetical protein